MPYIAIKAYPKDEEIKKTVAKEISDVFLKHWGCPMEAISVSFEEVKPEDWADVENKEIKPHEEKMYILSGEIKK
ncbi:MAG: tautomerase family protein [Clostridia bacterium]|nr:tautomerase family protein [Clostridia bacterium]